MQVTEHVALLSKWVAADLYAKELDLLQFELSMSRCSVDLWAAVEAIEAAHALADGAISGAIFFLVLVTYFGEFWSYWKLIFNLNALPCEDSFGMFDAWVCSMTSQHRSPVTLQESTAIAMHGLYTKR